MHDGLWSGWIRLSDDAPSRVLIRCHAENSFQQGKNPRRNDNRHFAT